MARQQDLGKLNKAKLGEFIAKKLSKEDLLFVAQAVQEGRFYAQQGALVTPADTTVQAPQGAPVAHHGAPVTPADTTATLGGPTTPQP